jgi:hypothetical protein
MRSGDHAAQICLFSPSAHKHSLGKVIIDNQKNSGSAATAASTAENFSAP